MESVLAYICENAEYAHLIFFGLLLLAGFNVPISEDVLILTGGAIAATCIPDHYMQLLIWIYFGCWISAWEAYFVGRTLGPKLYEVKWFSHILTSHRIERLHHYYEKFGVFTFIVGRFIPGGVRNALFMTAGLGRMPFGKFIARDGFACLISTNVLFYLGFIFGENYNVIVHYFKKYNLIVLGILATLLLCTTLYIWYSNRNKMSSQ